MESQGRNQWELSYQRNLSGLGVAPDFTVEREEFVSKVGVKEEEGEGVTEKVLE